MKLILGFLIAVLVVPSLWAKPVDGLYDARVPVPDQQQSSRQHGAKSGLVEVLHKVTGFPVPADNEVINRALDIADQYLYQFSYEAVGKDEWDASIPPGSSWLKMRFESKAVHRIIKQAQLPLWGSNRPTILVWGMIDENTRRVIVDGEESQVLKAIQSAAQKRGLPVILPLYDLEDSIRLPQESLWGLFSDPVKEASARYEADSVAAVRIFKGRNNKWTGQWRFYFKEREYQFEFETDGLLEQMLSGLSASAEVLANTYAIKPSDESNGSLKIQVAGIANLKQYAGVIKYLEKLSVTKSVFVSSVKGSDLQLDIALNGSLSQFNQVLRLDKKLNQIQINEPKQSDDELLVGQAQILQFKWQP